MTESAEPWESISGRDIAALQDPRPVCIIGACAPHGQVPGVAPEPDAVDAGSVESCFATVIWVTPISHTPPMLVFALREKSRTMELLRATRFCSVSLLPASQRGAELTEICGAQTGHRVDKAAQVPHMLVDANGQILPWEDEANECHSHLEKSGAPVPTEAVSWMLCTVEDVRETGDHMLVTCHVTTAHSRESRDEKGRIAPKNTLLCIQHGAYATGSKI